MRHRSTETLRAAFSMDDSTTLQEGTGRHRFAAVVPAAGVGTRMGGDVRKPYLSLCGRPVLCHALSALLACGGCAEIILVVHPDEYADPAEGWFEELMSEHGVTKFAPGGQTRQESVRRGLELVSGALELVLIHDAVRPLVEPALVSRVAAEVARRGAAIAAVPVVETAKQVDGCGRIVRTVDRRSLWRAQTPQGFRKDLILDAYRRAEADGFVGTDDSELVERLGERVWIVEDSPENIKITTPHDLAVAEDILRRRKAAAQARE